MITVAWSIIQCPWYWINNYEKWISVPTVTKWTCIEYQVQVKLWSRSVATIRPDRVNPSCHKIIFEKERDMIKTLTGLIPNRAFAECVWRFFADLMVSDFADWNSCKHWVFANLCVISQFSNFKFVSMGQVS